MPKTWEAKVTAIQEAKDLNILLLEELLGSLMTYELNQKQNAQEEEDKRKKSITFKSTTQENESESEDENEEELALITRKFKKFMRRR